jgi:hypothetical protein
MSQWQPIETAPKDGTVILLSTCSLGVIAAFWNGKDDLFKWTFLDGQESPCNRISSVPVEGWQPLPEPMK